jgi:hypothetical protein
MDGIISATCAEDVLDIVRHLAYYLCHTHLMLYSIRNLKPGANLGERFRRLGVTRISAGLLDQAHELSLKQPRASSMWLSKIITKQDFSLQKS